MPNPNRKIIENIISKTKIYIFIIFILFVVLCFYDANLILPSIIIFSAILFYSIYLSNKRKAEISNHIHDLIVNVDSTAKNTLINSPFPLVIVETDGNVVWKSTKFVDEFINIDIGNYLDEIIKEVKQDIITKKNKNISKQIKIGRKTYEVVGEYVKSKKGKKDEYMMTLYFIDRTEKLDLAKKLENSRTCIGIIMIDNYEEVMQRIPTENKPQAIASIEKALYEWAGQTGGLIVKQDRDTFVYSFEKKYLEQIESSKFSILDTIKEIKIDSQSQATLSIAISTEGESYYEKYKSAIAAMDIALGRGGDQAVIRKDGKYVFFGGRTQEIEKRTKVKARIVAGALKELILSSSNVMIMGHTNGDIDALGSALGIYRFAKTLGKEVNIVGNALGSSLTAFVDTLKQNEEYSELILTGQEAIAKTTQDTLLIIVDTHKRSYVDTPELLSLTNKIVIIDHHRKSTDFIEDASLLLHEVYASSAAELVIEILQYSENEIKLEQLEVEALYAGIMVDTKNFTFKTGVRTFEAAAYLRKCGVDIIKVKKWFQSDLESYKTISEIVKKAEIVRDSIGISVYEKQEKDTSLICAKAADELLTINNITASFVLGNLGEKVGISGRSIGDINVQLILEKLGGGGHITLAGAQVEGSIEEVKQNLINCINEYFNET